MKIDKSLYTKEEYKKLKRDKQQRKLAKAYAKKLKLDPNALQINILCLKHGVKYDSSYVNKLYTVVKSIVLILNFIVQQKIPRFVRFRLM